MRSWPLGMKIQIRVYNCKSSMALGGFRVDGGISRCDYAGWLSLGC